LEYLGAIRVTKRVWLSVAAVLIGISALSLGTAGAEPPTTPVPPPPAAATSSTDDLTDMVLDAIQHGAAPTTTPVPAPPH
jgi:hypothetical protein